MRSAIERRARECVLRSGLTWRAQGWYFGNQIFNVIVGAKDFFLEELPYSLIVYYVVFVSCAIVFIPFGPFCIAIGFIFGVYWGFLIQMGAIFLSSAVLFVIGRYLFKDYVNGLISKTDGSHVWKGLMKYMGKDWKEAAKINVLLCFMPVPYGSHPYLFSLTSVPFEQFVVFFMLGMIPNTVLNLLIGAAISEAAESDGINVYHLIGTGAPKRTHRDTQKCARARTHTHTHTHTHIAQGSPSWVSWSRSGTPAALPKTCWRKLTVMPRR